MIQGFANADDQKGSKRLDAHEDHGSKHADQDPRRSLVQSFCVPKIAPRQLNDHIEEKTIKGSLSSKSNTTYLHSFCIIVSIYLKALFLNLIKL